jgi:hypothetical protein
MLRVNRVMAAVLFLIGVALLLRTLQVGGGQVGFLAAAVFMVLGVLRWRAVS